MIDPKLLRDDLNQVKAAMARRHFVVDWEEYESLEKQRKEVQTQTEHLQSERNRISKAIGQKKAKGEPADDLMKEVGHLGSALDRDTNILNNIQSRLTNFLMRIPNMPHATVPDGKDETENQILRTWGEPKQYAFTPKDHVALGETLGMNFDRAAKLSGARFVTLFGRLAKLHRALGQFMLDVHTEEHGYEEVYVPYLAKAECFEGTGQLPKFKEDLFAVSHEDKDYYLIPTGEVPVTNLYRDEIIEAKQLPIQLTAHTPCFRKEAGSYGKDTRGMIRQHQFEKVELVRFVKPADSYAALDALTQQAEAILQKLDLPYRVMLLCTGDMGFSAARTHDLEVWMPGQNTYREISSCSNFEAFQARRMKTRFKENNEMQFVHTLNGSGLAIGRTLIAVLENYQEADGRIRIPEVLKPYMGNATHL